MKLIRTASTRRLLASSSASLVAVAAGTAIAVAAAGPGPVPARQAARRRGPQGACGPKVTGISADISFTNKLIDSSDFTRATVDPILQGATGRLWLSNDHQLRLELQSNNGDAQIVVNKRLVLDLRPDGAHGLRGHAAGRHGQGRQRDKSSSAAGAIPTLAEIQSRSNKLSQHVNVSGAPPTDVAGRPAYTVSVSPKHDGGLLGSGPARLGRDQGRAAAVRDLRQERLEPGDRAEGDQHLLWPGRGVGCSPSSRRRAPRWSRSQAPRRPRRERLHGAKTQGRAAKLATRRGQRRGRSGQPRAVQARRRPSTLVGLPRRGVQLLDWAASRPRWSPTARTWAASR